MPFTGRFTQGQAYGKLYFNGIEIDDSVFLKSDDQFYLLELIFPMAKDTFEIDSRSNINHDTFKYKKLFYLKSLEGKSKIINSDTLQALSYSQIKIPDKEYYEFYEKKKMCPMGNHHDNIIPYLWGLPTKKGQRLAIKGKFILKGCVGTGEGGQMFYCKLHNIEF